MKGCGKEKSSSIRILFPMRGGKIYTLKYKGGFVAPGIWLHDFWRKHSMEENLFGIYNDFVFFFLERNHVFFLIALSLISNSHIFLLGSVVLFPVRPPPMSKLKGKMA
jgi:hypothetical protein